MEMIDFKLDVLIALSEVKMSHDYSHSVDNDIVYEEYKRFMEARKRPYLKDKEMFQDIHEIGYKHGFDDAMLRVAIALKERGMSKDEILGIIESARCVKLRDEEE